MYEGVWFFLRKKAEVTCQVAKRNGKKNRILNAAMAKIKPALADGRPIVFTHRTASLWRPDGCLALCS